MSRRHLHYYTVMPIAFASAADRLAGSPGDWLPLPAVWDGTAWKSDTHAGGLLPSRISPAVRVDVDESVLRRADDGEVVLRPMSWRPVRGEEWLPTLEADLELASIGPGHCQLSLFGSYRPPLSVIGGAADHVLGHRVAEATVRTFVLDIAQRLEAATLPV